jgi:hypothetical protein
LPEIVKAVSNKIEIYLDGGVTQGTDVFKALALGAKMVILWESLIRFINGMLGPVRLIVRFIFIGFFWKTNVVGLGLGR